MAGEQDPPTFEEMIEMRLEDLINADNFTTQHFQFNFCLKLVEDVPGLLNVDNRDLSPTNISVLHNNSVPSNPSSNSSTTASLENALDGFENACNEHKHHLEASSDPIIANAIDLCHHLEDALNDRFALGLPSVATRDGNHFCTYFVDQVFPSEIEPPCMLFMEKVQYKHAVTGKDYAELENQALTCTLIPHSLLSAGSLVPFPQIMKEAGFDTAYMEVCSNTDEHSRLSEAYADAEVCEARLVDIRRVAGMAYDTLYNATMLSFTSEFCDAIAAPLHAPNAQMTEHIKNTAERKHLQVGTMRQMVAGVFALAQGHRHQIVNSHGRLLEPKHADFPRGIEDMSSHSGSTCDWGAGNGMCTGLSSDQQKTGACQVQCGTSKWPDISGIPSQRPLSMECKFPDMQGHCYQKVIGDISTDETSDRLRSACTGVARVNAVGTGFSVGPMEIGTNIGHGYVVRSLTRLVL